MVRQHDAREAAHYPARRRRSRKPSRKGARLCRGSFRRVTFDDNPPAGHRNGQNVSKVLRGLRKLRHLRTSPTIDRNDLRLQSRKAQPHQCAAYLSTIPRRSPFSRLPAGHAGGLSLCLVPLLSPVGGLRPRVSRAPCGGALPAASSTARATPRHSYEDTAGASVRPSFAIVSPYRASCVPHEDG